MTLTLDQARALPNSLSPVNAEDGTAMSNFAHLHQGESIPQSKIGHSRFQIRPLSGIPHIPSKPHWGMLQCPRFSAPKANRGQAAPARPSV
jgi:hypothetical protein